MRKIKNIVSILLAFAMMFSMVISPSALVVNDYNTITSAHENGRAVVIGKAPEYADELVTVMLLRGDGENATPADILYMDTVQADENGYYESKLAYKGFEILDGKVTNCSLKARVGALDITDSIISATVSKTDMMAVELETTLSGNSASAVANLNSLFGEDLNATVMIAAYDEYNRLIGVKTQDKFVTDENDTISVEYKDVPTVERLIAYVWESTTSLIPYMGQVSIELPNAVKDLVIHPGSDETKRRFTWYNTQETSGAQVQYALKADYIKDGGFTAENSIVVEGRTEVPHMNTKDLSCKAEIEGLELGTEYVYRVGSAYSFDKNVYSFKTHEVEDKQVFAIVSDIHNNMRSNASLEDSAAVEVIKRNSNAFNSLMKIYPETQFIISAGDNISIGGNGYEVDDTNKESYRVIQELEMDQLFAPSIFRNVPFISATGNHETMKIGEPHGGVTKYHYNVPNEMYNEKGVIGSYLNTNQIGNWWFRNGDVLVISIMLHKTIKTGNYVNVTAAANKEYIEAALEANPDAKWKIVINHVPAYGSVVHTGEEHDQRDLFAELGLDELGIDAVISGHQHAYSRSKQLLTNKYEDTETFTFTSKNNKQFTMMKPKVVEGAIIDGVDAKGNQLDTAIDPKGTVHIDVPSFGASSHDTMVADFKDFIEAHGISVKDKAKWPDQTIIPADEMEDALPVAPPSILFVTVEKNTDGTEQIKFEYVKTYANKATESDKFDVLDTYIIKKTK